MEQVLGRGGRRLVYAGQGRAFAGQDQGRNGGCLSKSRSQGVVGGAGRERLAGPGMPVGGGQEWKLCCRGREDAAAKPMLPSRAPGVLAGLPARPSLRQHEVGPRGAGICILSMLLI